MPRQLRKCRQATQRQDAQGQRVSAPPSVPGSWAVSTKRDSYLSALFHRLAARRGSKRATMAVRHAILVIAFHLLKRKQNYVELGVNSFDQKNADCLRRSLVKRLEWLGHTVALGPIAQPA